MCFLVNKVRVGNTPVTANLTGNAICDTVNNTELSKTVLATCPGFGLMGRYIVVAKVLRQAWWTITEVFVGFEEESM